jgi:FixJ family two-component response regulator
VHRPRHPPGRAERLRRAGAAEGDGGRGPVIFITSHDDEATHARAGRSGAAAYLRKPFEESALLDAIERAIGKADQS